MTDHVSNLIAGAFALIDVALVTYDLMLLTVLR